VNTGHRYDIHSIDIGRVGGTSHTSALLSILKKSTPKKEGNVPNINTKNYNNFL
jgi:hypothetical protein